MINMVRKMIKNKDEKQQIMICTKQASGNRL